MAKRSLPMGQAAPTGLPAFEDGKYYMVKLRRSVKIGGAVINPMGTVKLLGSEAKRLQEDIVSAELEPGQA